MQELHRQQSNEYGKTIKSYERPQKSVLVPEDFTVDNEMLTPSLKLKRRNVVARYNDRIEALYAAGSGGKDD